MKYRPLGDIFEYEGHTLQVVRSTGWDCFNCVFNPQDTKSIVRCCNRDTNITLECLPRRSFKEIPRDICIV